jgi:HlyD family secretion protein
LITWLSKWKRPIVAICAFALVGGSGWFLYTKGPLGPPKVTVVKAHKENLNPAVFGIGTVEARLSYTVGPTQAGRLLSTLVDHGDKVNAGQLLGEIDPVDLDQKLQSASASTAKAQSEVASSQAQVRDTYSRNALAQTNVKRYNDLLAAQAISAELTDSKQNEANAAQAAYDSAQASLTTAQKEVERAISDQNAIVSQRTNLQLISPINGLIVSRDAESGTTVVAGQSVFHLVDPTTLWVRTRIDQSRFYGIAIGQPASIVLRSRPDAPLVGKVTRLEVQGDNVTEERFVDVAFSDLGGMIPLGELAEVTIDLPPLTDTLVVPTAAVKRLNKQNGVWIVENDHLRFLPIMIGAQTLDGQTQIIDGLNPGDAVVVYSPKQLADGMSVRVDKKQ